MMRSPGPEDDVQSSRSQYRHVLGTVTPALPALRCLLTESPMAYLMNEYYLGLGPGRSYETVMLTNGSAAKGKNVPSLAARGHSSSCAREEVDWYSAPRSLGARQHVQESQLPEDLGNDE